MAPLVIARLGDEWQAHFVRWQWGDLSARRYVYIRANDVYLPAYMKPKADCLLVLISTTLEDRKNQLGCHVGMRESSQN